MTPRALAAVALLCAALAAPAAALGRERPPDLSRTAAAILVDARDGAVILAKDPGSGGRSRAPPS